MHRAGICALLSTLGCGSPQPAKTVLTATPEAVTLIQDTQAICVKTAKAGVARFEEQSPSGDLVESLHKYFDGEAAPELAVVDKAGELISDLLPKVREESPRETVRAVEDLFEAQKQVCKMARTPRSSKLSFQDNLKYAINDYVEARDKLAALYTVPDADAQFARHKFSAPLDEARASVPAAPPETGVRVASAEQYYDRERQEWEKVQEYQAGSRPSTTPPSAAGGAARGGGQGRGPATAGQPRQDGRSPDRRDPADDAGLVRRLLGQGGPGPRGLRQLPGGPERDERGGPAGLPGAAERHHRPPRRSRQPGDERTAW